MKLKFKKYWRKTSFKKRDDGEFLLNHIYLRKPKNFLEIGVFHGVTSRNVCELLHSIHGNNFYKENVIKVFVEYDSKKFFQFMLRSYTGHDCGLTHFHSWVFYNIVQNELNSKRLSYFIP